MSDSTPRLRLPELVSMQEANCVTWNEALVQLDAFVDLYLLGQYVDTPPASPADGDAYLTGGSPTGAWSGYAYKIASCIDGGWRFYTPFNGLRAYVATTGAFIVYANGTWTDWSSQISANETSVASAATCDLGAAGSLFVQITGTTTITSFGTGANKLCFVRFAQALTLTHNATSLILLGGASRTTAAGDVGLYASDASGNWRERSYSPAADNPADILTATNTKTLTNKTLGATSLPGSGCINSSGYLGIGTATPVTQVHLVDQAAASTRGFVVDEYYSNACGAQAWFRKARGSLSSPAAVNNGDYVGAFVFAGHDGANFIGKTFLGARVSATPSSGSVPMRIYLGTEDIVRFSVEDDGTVVPGADNTQDFGSASLRWATIYAGTGTINTSGAGTKTNVRVLSAAENAVAKALAANVRVFQFCDAAAKKGEAARLHTGMVYEDVVAAFTAQGLDPERYGILCRDPAMTTVTKTRTVQRDGETVEETYDDTEPDLDETGAPKWVLGLRYSELAQFVMAGLAARLAALEAK